jgi:hypothetical protein
MCLHQENSYKHMPGMEKKSLSWSDELVVYPEVVRPNARALFKLRAWPPLPMRVVSRLSRTGG